MLVQLEASFWHGCSETAMSVPQMSFGDRRAAVHFSESHQPMHMWNTALAESIKTQICCILVDGWSQAILFVLQWLERNDGCVPWVSSRPPCLPPAQAQDFSAQQAELNFATGVLELPLSKGGEANEAGVAQTESDSLGLFVDVLSLRTED